MKKYKTRAHLMLKVAFWLLVTINISAQVGINTDGTDPDVSSILHAKGDATKKNVILEPGTTGGVGIGVTDPDAKLEVNGQIKITGGTPGADKVLTSDADGLATWAEATSSPEVGNYGTVTNPITGKTWLDRNLGASQVATSSTDAAAYGDLYQWGRAQEGHEDRASAIYGSQATTWLAGLGAWEEKFITGDPSWLDTTSDELWKGTDAENNPCPSGFRIPTNAEWNQERRTWATNDASGAFDSVLKLSIGGARNWSDGGLGDVGSAGCYWSSTTSGLDACFIYFNSTTVFVTPYNQAFGFSVRCIKD